MNLRKNNKTKKIRNKFCLHKTNNKTEQVDLSMNRKNDGCQDTEMEATNKSTNDFIRNNVNSIGKTCFTLLFLILLNFITYTLFTFFLSKLFFFLF